MLHFIRVYTVCNGKKRSLDKMIKYFVKIITWHPRYVQWTIPNLLIHPRRKNPLAYKGLTSDSNLVCCRFTVYYKLPFQIHFHSMLLPPLKNFNTSYLNAPKRRLDKQNSAGPDQQSEFPIWLPYLEFFLPF